MHLYFAFCFCFFLSFFSSFLNGKGMREVLFHPFLLLLLVGGWADRIAMEGEKNVWRWAEMLLLPNLFDR